MLVQGLAGLQGQRDSPASARGPESCDAAGGEGELNELGGSEGLAAPPEPCSSAPSAQLLPSAVGASSELHSAPLAPLLAVESLSELRSTTPLAAEPSSELGRLEALSWQLLHGAVHMARGSGGAGGLGRLRCAVLSGLASNLSHMGFRDREFFEEVAEQVGSGCAYCPSISVNTAYRNIFSKWRYRQST